MTYSLEVSACGNKSGVLFLDPGEGICIFTYTEDSPISVVMPVNKIPYVQKERFSLLPIFDQFMPECWLCEAIRNHLNMKLNKEVKNYDVFYHMALNVKNFHAFKARITKLDRDCLLKREKNNQFFILKRF